jgi:disulfide bond formation protein DsbB
MLKRKYSKYLFIACLLFISLFFITSQYFHTEKSLEFDENCPICLFERIATLFWTLISFLLIFSSLHLIVLKIFYKENKIKFSLFSHILGQRAPPLI